MNIGWLWTQWHVTDDILTAETGSNLFVTGNRNVTVTVSSKWHEPSPDRNFLFEICVIPRQVSPVVLRFELIHDN